MMEQLIFTFDDGGHKSDRGRNSRRDAVALQIHPMPTEPKAMHASLMRAVVQEETLERAWKAVRRNRGGPGVDDMSIDLFESWWNENHQRIVDELLAGNYQPQPVKRCEIPKAKGGTRVLGIPTVLDRVIQQAIVQVLTPIFDPGFPEHRYGFRPGRSAHGAVLAARSFAAYGFRWVVDIDLRAFFDQVNNDVLMGRLAKRVADRDLLRLIRLELNQYLRGWFGYLRLIETPSVLKKFQGWIQRKLRCYRIKQSKRASRLFFELKRLGRPAAELVWLLSTSRGPWRLSHNSQVHQGSGPHYWAKLGLFNLPTSWRSFQSTT